jgi:plastocyanin
VKFHSSARTSGTFKRKLTRAGTYRIYCTIHGAADQSMRLVVK